MSIFLGWNTWPVFSFLYIWSQKHQEIICDDRLHPFLHATLFCPRLPSKKIEPFTWLQRMHICKWDSVRDFKIGIKRQRGNVDYGLWPKLLAGVHILAKVNITYSPFSSVDISSKHWNQSSFLLVCRDSFFECQIFFFFFDVDLYFLKSLLNLLQYCFCFMFWCFWPRGMWDLSSPTRDRTRRPCIGRRSLNHWTAREVP